MKVGSFLISETIPTKAVDAKSVAANLRERISSKKAHVGVLGLGYVGLPLAVEFARAGFEVTGIDVQQSKVDQFNAGQSYVKDVQDDLFGPLVRSGKLRATSDFSVIEKLDTIDICVPTPLRKTKDPDMSFVVAATDAIAQHMHPGLLVMLESTTYPGTTDELVLPKLQASGLEVGKDFFLCFSLSALIPATRSTRRQTFLRSLAASRPPAPKWARSSTSKRLRQWFQSVPRASPKW